MPAPYAALQAWLELLATDGRLLLIEGRWHTGAGLSADDATALVRKVREHVHVEQLTDPALWGGPINDERYLLLSCR